MAWEPASVRRLAEADEIDIVVPAPNRPDVRTPIWVVAVDGDLYVRSWKGPDGIWFRRAHRFGTGSVAFGGQDYRVSFTAADDPDLNARIDDAYRGKYGTSSYTRAMTGPPATTTTMRLDPA